MELFFFHIILLQCLLFVSIVVQLTQGKCEPIIFSTTKVRNAHVQVKLIELVVHSPKFDYQKLPSLSISFQPSLMIDEDYKIDFLKPENSLPAYINPHKHQNITLLGLILKPGKVWLKDTNHTKDLHIMDAVACDTAEEAKNHQSTNNQNLRVASFFWSKTTTSLS